MIGRILKLAVAVLVLHAALRAGMVASRYYRLRDSAWQVVVRGPSVPTDQLGNEIFDQAVELGVPLERGDIDVRRNREVTTAEAFYTEPVLLLPGVTYPLDLSFSVEGVSITVDR